MLDFISKGIAKVFGTKSEKDVKSMLPMVEAINEEYVKLQGLSDDQLRDKTKEIKKIIDDHLSEIDDQIAGLHQQVADNPDLDIHQKEDLFKEVDRLEEERNEQLEDVLLEVLPQGFAVVKDTARRFKEQGSLRVTATLEDKAFAQQYANVELDGEEAIWHNKWIAGGNEITWDMLHYDVQLIGGVVLHQGKIAEMATGEGKTLVATLPAFLNALADRGVHIVTVNNYLAIRDCEWMAPIFQFHGMKVDCIDRHQPNSEERRNAYKAHIIYGTNNEFGFDYLRDNMSREPKELVQRRHHFCHGG